MSGSAQKIDVGFLVFPNLTQLDLTGPAQVFTSSKRCNVHLIWKNRDAVKTDGGWSILPTATFAAVSKLDVICVPGGTGQIDLMEDEETLEFLRRISKEARYITSVCTGSLVLAAAGLLQNYRATSHWLAVDQLALFKAIPERKRIVKDGNRITGAGVTSGIDFALYLLHELFGSEISRQTQIQIEYDPSPEFTFTDVATAQRLDAVKESNRERQSIRLRASEKAAKKLSKS